MLTWACGLLPDQTLKEVTEDLRRFEGVRPYMYLDTVSTVTVGVGTALFAMTDVDSINFVDATTQLPVSQADKRAAWQSVQNVSKPRGATCKYSPDHFKDLTSIIILKGEQDRLLNIKLDEFYLNLVRIYPGFDSMQASAKIALFDMIYNLGPRHLEYTFTHFTKAIRARHWASAATQSYRPQVNFIRNARIKAYFENCVPDGANNMATQTKKSRSVPATRPHTASNLPLPPPPEPFPRTPYQKPTPAPLRIVRNPIIRQGDHGLDVRVVQNALNRVLVARRPPLTLDGKFGLMTTSAVRAVQAFGGLVPDGLVGGQTRTALDLILI